MTDFSNPALGFDSSFDLLTNEEAECLKALGALVYWQCAWTGIEKPVNCVENLRTADRHGYLLALYISLPDNATDGFYHVTKGLTSIPTGLLQKLQLVVVDVERPGIRAVAIRDAINMLRSVGYLAAIYTSLNAWTNDVVFDSVHHNLSFTDVPLMNAFWRADQQPHPVADFVTYPYGGWTTAQLIGEQYTGDIPQCGQELDHDIWNMDLFPGGGTTMPDPVPAPLPPPTSQQNAAAAGYLLGIAVKLAANGTLTTADKDLLRFFGAA